SNHSLTHCPLAGVVLAESPQPTTFSGSPRRSPSPTNTAKTTPSASASHTHTLCQRGPIFTAKNAPRNAPSVLHHQSSTEVRPTENTYWQISMPRLSRAAIHTARHTENHHDQQQPQRHEEGHVAHIVEDHPEERRGFLDQLKRNQQQLPHPLILRLPQQTDLVEALAHRQRQDDSDVDDQRGQLQ